jgi:curved DNA-binding protein CbpA
MTSVSKLEVAGDLRIHPFAELLAEVGELEFSGSLRMTRGDRKAIAYFREGMLVYCVSNAREHRLLAMLLKTKRIGPQMLERSKGLGSDIEFIELLKADGVFDENEIAQLIGCQQKLILEDLIRWADGEWVFSPLAKLRDDIEHPVDVREILVRHARELPSGEVFDRFKSLRESFRFRSTFTGGENFQTHEAKLLEQLNGMPVTIEELKRCFPLPDAALYQSLYSLWLGGTLQRSDWNSAFSRHQIEEIRNARLSVVKKAPALSPSTHEKPAETQKPAEPAPARELSLDEYMEQVENAETFYELLGVAPKAAISEIKAAYFALARQFHPDRFHKDAGADLQRIQSAFSNLAQAYETLRSTTSRETYDLKMQKEIAFAEKRRREGIAGVSEIADAAAGQALEDFEEGLALLMDGESEAAVPYLARAAHYNPENALYRAYLGKALSTDSKRKHRAEAELQAAAKLEPANPKIRLMLVEFFADMGMRKRAEGELRRFLDIAPNNAEARRMLERLAS